jgi:hypothetical protein
MSSNNLYNILNTLKNLEPNEAPVSTESKPVYESVGAKGSIMTGVAGIEKKLSEAYVAEKAKNPYAVGMAAAMKSTGDTPPLKKSTITKAHDIAKKVKEAAPHEKLPIDQLGLDKFAQAKLAAQPNKLKREKNKMVMQRTMQNPDNLSEFAPGAGGDDGGDDGFDEETLRKMAAQWFNGDEDPQVERVLAAAGWEIGQDEGYDDEPGVFVVMSGDENGKSYISWPADELRSGMAEGELTKTSTGVRHRGTYGTEYQGDADEEEAAAKAAEKGPKKRGRPAKGMAKPKPAAGEKKGRGRPAKAAAPTYSGAKDLQSFFGSKAPKSKAKGTVHRMDEARIMDGANETLQHVLNRFKHEVKQFEQTGDLDNDLYEALFDYYMDSGEMPYGVAKARTGDPYNWITDRLSADMGMAEAVNPMSVQGQQMQAHTFKPGEQVKSSNGEVVKVVAVDMASGMVKVANRFGDETTVPATRLSAITGQPAPQSAPAPQPTMEDDLNELARLAGLEVSEAAKPDYIDLDKDGDKKEPMKKAAQDAKEVDEALDPVGKEDDDVDNDGDKDSSDEYLKARREKISKNIKEAEQMLDMMRIAGLDTSKAEAALAEAKKYGDTDVEEAPEYANSPDEEVENVDAIIRQGNDLNREKKQYADKPKAGDNPMATEGSVDPLAALGNRLMQAYESIKVKSRK